MTGSRARFRVDAPMRLLLLAAPLFGVLVLVFTPPFQAPDEPAHLFRAWQVSEGVLVGEKRGARSGGEVPASLVTAYFGFTKLVQKTNIRISPAEIGASFEVPLQADRKRFVGFENTTVYSPVPYLPQALAALVARSLDLPALAALYLARLCNLVAAIGVIVLALAVAPVAHWILVAVVLTPMFVFQMASASPDALTNSIALLWTALVLRLALRDSRARSADLVLLALVAVLLALCKQAYLALLLLVVIIPSPVLGGAVRRVISLAGVLAAAAGSVLLWTYLVAPVYAPMVHLRDIDPAGQLGHILSAPLEFARLLAENLIEGGPSYLQRLIGARLGWLDTPLPTWFVALYGAGLAVIAWMDTSGAGRLRPWQRASIAGLVVLGVLTVLTLVYLNVNPVGSDAITQVQGRYFLPFLPLALLVLHRGREALRRLHHGDLLARGAPLLAGLSLTVTVSSLLTRYYY